MNPSEQKPPLVSDATNKQDTQDPSTDVVAADAQVDQLHRDVFAHVLGTTWEGAAHTTVDATLASRYHERFADHAVGIAKKVKYLATGDWTGDDDARAEIRTARLDQLGVERRQHLVERGEVRRERRQQHTASRERRERDAILGAEPREN